MQPGLVLVAGDNKVEPRLGANGAGKSTLFDGLTYCLTGTSTKGARTSDLISHGGTTTGVECIFDIDDEEISVFRNGPPNRLFINGNAVEQGVVDKLIGMGRQRLLNSVIFAQGASLFIDLSIPERGAFLDEILDLQYWMRASEKAGKKHKETTESLNRLRIALSRDEGALSSVEDIGAIEVKEQAWEKEKEANLEELLVEFEVKSIALDELESKEINTKEIDTNFHWAEYQKKLKTVQEFNQQISIDKAKLGEIEREIQFTDNNDFCNVCHQPITKTFAHKHIENLQGAVDKLKERIEQNKLDLDGAGVTADQCESVWRKANDEKAKIERENAVKKADAASLKSHLNSLEGRLERIANQVNPYTDRKNQVEEEKKKYEEVIAEKKQDETKLMNQLAQFDFWREAFKRVRLFCISKVLNQLDLEVMNSASSLGLIGWKISFTTESEGKSGGIKTGVQIEVKAPARSGSFISWSFGEGQRVRLAVALGFASLIQRWSGVRWDLEIFDEPTNWLSEAGIADLIEVLKSRADRQNKRIFIADHRGIQHESVSKVLTVVKDEEGSHVV
jgi:DNA repair exonuclease SbcCD ATPase subunit